MGASVPITAAGITLLVLGHQEIQTARELENHFADLSDFDARRQEHLNRAADYRRWGTIGTAVGATGFLTGAMLYSAGTPTAAPRDDAGAEETAAARFNLRPYFGLNQAGLVLRF